MKSLATTALCLMAGVMPMHAEEDKPTVHLNLQTRASYVNDRIGSEVQHDASGMKGDYLFLSLYGNINDRLSYNWRQRVNSKITRNDIFEATDWIYIDYKLTKNWTVSAGKQVIMVGSWEYDRNPIDIYTPSEYWNNVAPFKFGASIAYTTTSGNDRFLVQASESMYNEPTHHDLMGYSLYWAGKHGILSTQYSVNLMEYAPSRYISFIGLGNRLDVNNASLELDFINRAASHQTYLFKDCSVIARLDYRIIPELAIYGKLAYDVNKSGMEADKSVTNGTELTTYGGGLEYYPMKGKPDLRVNLSIAHTTGTNTNPAGTNVDNKTMVKVGVAAKLHLL